MKEIVRYAVVDDDDGTVYSSFFSSERDAVTSIYNSRGRSIVKLVGTLPEPKKMKKVASYLYQDDSGRVFQANQLATEEEAKQECEKYGVKLILWPYGSVIEIEE